MSIAEKLTTIAENEQKVYNAGYEKGKSEGGDTEAAYNNGFEDGKQAEYDRFWDNFQDYGKRINYSRCFWAVASGINAWTDKTYNPKYPIKTQNGFEMYHYANITSTKVPIEILSGNMQRIFANCPVETIPLLKISGTIPSTSEMFLNCTNLKHITFEGEIGKSISFQHSPLTMDSVNSIITALKDLTGETAQTLTLHNTVGSKLTDEQKAIITAKNWTLVY